MEKRRCIYTISESGIFFESLEKFGSLMSEKLNYTVERIDISDVRMDDIADAVDKNDVAMLIVGLSSDRDIQMFLYKFRELRVPYIFIKEGQDVDFSNIAVPVTFLEEEKEKGPFASAFGRFFGSVLHIFKPKDYGSKADRNINAICSLFDTFGLVYDVTEGKKDSLAIELEAVLSAEKGEMGLVIVSASREYGLDDIIFGPKERRIVKRAGVPVMLINPRGDLYTLCD